MNGSLLLILQNYTDMFLIPNFPLFTRHKVESKVIIKNNNRPET